MQRPLRRRPAAGRRTAGPLIASVALLSIAGAACGSSGGNNSAQSSTTSTTTGSTGQNVEADKAAAQAASLKLSDFPAGWTSQPATYNNNPSQGLTAQLAKCLGVSQAALTKAPARYESPDFSEPSSNNSVSSDVGYRATAHDQQTAFAIVSGSKVPGCLATAVAAVIDDAIKHPTKPSDTLPAGAKVGTTKVSQMSFPQVGDKSIAYQIDVPVSYGGLSLHAYLDEIFVIKGRASTAMTFQGSSEPFPVDQAQHYTELVVGRLTDT